MGKKAHKQWLSLAMDMQTRQVIAFHVGDRNRQSARRSWKRIPAVYRGAEVPSGLNG
jgi:IS1 family transposase